MPAAAFLCAGRLNTGRARSLYLAAADVVNVHPQPLHHRKSPFGQLQRLILWRETSFVHPL